MRTLLLCTIPSIALALALALPLPAAAQAEPAPAAKHTDSASGGPDILVDGTRRPKHHDWRDKYHGGHIHCMMMLKKGQMVRDCR